MSVLKIYKYPENVLKKKALKIENIDGGLQTLIDDMVQTMYNAPGIGLAANQVGELKRLVVIDISTKEKSYPLIIVINPEIVHADKFEPSEEGCLSLPGCTISVDRASEIVVRGIDRNGNPIEIEAKGLLARAFQHELDHLDGIVLFDKLSPIKREFYKKKYLKSLKDEK
ncbi:MAG TPA: peptide deformylase [Nitrospirae bacterium]|nr:peptide deformylase [Nitrospirota bacterium]